MKAWCVKRSAAVRLHPHQLQSCWNRREEGALPVFVLLTPGFEKLTFTACLQDDIDECMLALALVWITLSMLPSASKRWATGEVSST